MAKSNSQTKQKRIRPASNPEARENQLISLAVDLAERQLVEGTASSQVITHYLKLGTKREKIEREILEKQRELISAKTESIKNAEKTEKMYKEALDAMKRYSGASSNIVDEDYGDDVYDDY